MERAFSYGVGSLSNTELIALIIRTGTKENSALELAGKIINEFESGFMAYLLQARRNL